MTRRGLCSGKRVPCMVCNGDPLALTRGPRWRRCGTCRGRGVVLMLSVAPRGARAAAS